ncbi:MAG: transposase, partial [Planctomycetota bacterium]
MQVRFDRKTYRKRVQVETVVSMIKRRLGNHVRARSRWGQVRELALVVLTRNLMILGCSILFYRADLPPFLANAAASRAAGGRRVGSGRGLRPGGGRPAERRSPVHR